MTHSKQHCSSMHKIDRISYLPDPIRSCIVSFLPIKDAIKTKLLSKRWNDMCASLSNLDFDQLSDREDLHDIIDQILILHDGSDIHRFNINLKRCAEHVSSFHLNTWITFALKHNVSEIIVNVPKGHLKMVPSSLFKSSTLTSLELHNCHFNLPSNVYFPALKTLDFDAVTFSDEFRTSKLFSDSSCPILEELIISHCHLDGFTTLFISFTTLKSFYIWDRHDDVRGLNFGLSCPNLYEFFYEGNTLPELTPDTLSSLSIATFEILALLSDISDTKNLAWKILKGLVNVHTLKLRGYYIELLAMLQDVSTPLPTPYYGLKDLVLCLDLSPKSQLHVITFLLRSFPNLQTLFICFYEGDEDDHGEEENMQPKAFSTRCMLKNLRTVKFGEFQGRETEIDLVRYLLENAAILKKLNIQWACSKYENVESRMTTDEKLLSFPHLSSHARIYIC